MTSAGPALTAVPVTIDDLPCPHPQTPTTHIQAMAFSAPSPRVAENSVPWPNLAFPCVPLALSVPSHPQILGIDK